MASQWVQRGGLAPASCPCALCSGLVPRASLAVGMGGEGRLSDAFVDYLLPNVAALGPSPAAAVRTRAEALAVAPQPRNRPEPLGFAAAPAGITNADVFALSSNPQASQTIYLDFDGYDTSATEWNHSARGSDRIASVGIFSLDATVSTVYSQAELDAIKEVFLRVAADFAPFSINVTTRRPDPGRITRSTTADTSYGTVVAIGSVDRQYPGAGGVAFLNVYGFVDPTDRWKPALVFSDRLSGAKSIAEAASHEAGHNLNLSHDGIGSREYYEGGGLSPGWAPIMGVGYYQPLTQFSRGQYAGATNLENDFLNIIGQGVSRYGESPQNADFASAVTIALDGSGYGGAYDWIGLTADDGNGELDYDYFRFTPDAAGEVTISVNNALIFSRDNLSFDAQDLPSGYGNLHLDAQLLDGSGRTLADWDGDELLDVTGLTFSGLVSNQDYYVRVGPNLSLADSIYGETAWGSLGAYALRIQVESNGQDDSGDPVTGILDLPSLLKLRNRGTTSVRLFGNAQLDVTELDLATLGFGLDAANVALVKMNRRGNYVVRYSDLNQDGIQDLEVQIKNADLSAVFRPGVADVQGFGQFTDGAEVVFGLAPGDSVLFV